MCQNCEKNDFIQVEIRLKGKTYVPIADGWGTVGKTCIVRDIKDNVFCILKNDVVTEPIEYCPKCGRKLDERKENMTIKLTKQQFERAINNMIEEKYDGTWHFKIGEYNGRTVAIVLGWSCDYEESQTPVKHYIRKFGRTWTLCAKIAINIDDLQCDYQYDWYMPQYGDGDVYDTDHAVVSDLNQELEYLKEEAEWVLNGLKNGELSLEC